MLREKSFHVTVRAVVSVFWSRHTSRPEFFNRIDPKRLLGAVAVLFDIPHTADIVGEIDVVWR